MLARSLPRPSGLASRTALLAAAAALALVAGLIPAQAASTPGWRITDVLPASTEIYSTAATSAGNAWGVGMGCGDPCEGGTNLLAEHWTGSHWQTIAPPAGFSTSVGTAVTAASSPSNAWVFANQGTNVESTIALRWNGNSWTDQSDFPAWSGVTASVVIGKADAWAFGQIISPQSTYVAHYNGTAWSQVAFPGTVTPQDAARPSRRATIRIESPGFTGPDRCRFTSAEGPRLLPDSTARPVARSNAETSASTRRRIVVSSALRPR